MTENQTEVKQDTPIDYVFAKGATVTLTANEYKLLITPLMTYSWPIAICNKIRDRGIADGTLLPVFLSDINPETGTFIDEDAFFDKHTKKDNSIILDNTDVKAAKN